MENEKRYQGENSAFGKKIRVKVRMGMVFSAFVVGFSLMAAAAIGSYVFYRVRIMDNAVSVTGSARESVTADTVKWTGQFSRSVAYEDFKDGIRQMKEDEGKVISFLKEQGLTEKDFTFSAVSFEEPFKYNPGLPKEYFLQENVTVNSGEVQKITAVSKDTRKLTDAGIVFGTQSLEYYYSQLPAKRIALLSQAIGDARQRVEVIARGSGREVGFVKAASMGVVQVLPPNSVDVSDYGAYDTSTIEKVVMTTVKVTFTLK